MMMQTYDGAKVVDTQGQPVGAVERSYVDRSGTVRLVEVAIGSFFPKYRLVPVAEAQLRDGRLAVPYTKDMIVESPDASLTHTTLEGELRERVWAYYGPDGESTDVAMASSAVAPSEDVTVAPAGQAGAWDDTSERAPASARRIGYPKPPPKNCLAAIAATPAKAALASGLPNAPPGPKTWCSMSGCCWCICAICWAR